MRDKLRADLASQSHAREDSGRPASCTGTRSRLAPGDGALRSSGALNVRLAPKATEGLRCRELTRCANRVLVHRSKQQPYSITSGGGKQR
jgi:hypothetical protein